MRRTSWLPRIIAVVVLVPVAVGFSFAVTFGMEERQVTLDLRDSPVGDALRTVFRDTPFSFTLSPEVDKQKKVTVSLKGVPLAAALRAIGNAANLEITAEPDNRWVYVVKPRPTVTMGGAQVPVVGAMTLGADPAGAGGGTGISRGFYFVGPTEDTASLLTRVGTGVGRGYALGVPPAGPGEKLVDLDVKEAPIREAMAQLAKASGVEIVVHPAVSPQIKVTVRAFTVPADWLLTTIVSQCHLTVVTETIPAHVAPLVSAEQGEQQQFLPGRCRYHIVPPPEIRVTGVPEGPEGPRPRQR